MKALAAIALLATLVDPAQARLIRVAKDGSGDYKTLEKALKAAQAGDRIAAAGDGFVGLAMKKEGESFLAEGVVPGSPAEKAGLATGDRVVLVGDQDIAKLTLEEVVARVRGPVGGSVVLHVQKSGQGDAKRIVIVRGQREYDVSDDLSKAKIAWWSNEPETAVPFATAAAEAGDGEAAWYVSTAYQQGHGVRQDAKKGVEWLRKAALAGNPSGQLSWGFALWNGVAGAGLARDFAGSAQFLKPAFERSGNAEAARELAWLYHNGQGVPRDEAEAERLFKLAIDGKSQQAPKDLETVRARASAATASSASAARPASAPSPGVSRDDIRLMMAEALRDAKKNGEAKSATAEERSSDADKPNYSKPQHPDDVAVVIGIEKYASLPDASYAEHDADAVRAHLLALGFPQRNVFVLKGQSATRSAFVKELESRLRRLVNERSTVFVYYSGHGAPDPKNGEAFLVPYDGDPEFLDDTAYPVKRLYAKLAALPAKRVIVALDSCFSGAGGRSVLAKGMRPLVSKVEAGPAMGGRVAALTAAKGSEISGAIDEQSHGLFTYYLLKGLNEGAKTLGELEAYVKPRVEDEARRHNRDQTPLLFGADAAKVELK